MQRCGFIETAPLLKLNINLKWNMLTSCPEKANLIIE